VVDQIRKGCPEEYTACRHTGELWTLGKPANEYIPEIPKSEMG